MRVLLLADLVLDLVHRELALEVEQVVEELDPAPGEVIEQVRVRTVLLVEYVRQREELLVRFNGLLDPLQPDLAGTEILLDPERDERGLKEVLLETIVAKGVDKLDQMGDLARVDDVEPVDIPAHGVTGFTHPPIVVFAESNDAPIECGSGLGHGFSYR